MILKIWKARRLDFKDFEDLIVDETAETLILNISNILTIWRVRQFDFTDFKDVTQLENPTVGFYIH